RDSFQLVTEQITVLYPKKGVSEMARMTPDAVVEKYGLTPAQYPDFAALRGDPSDNLPSIPGVGEKTAAKWIVEYGSLKNLITKIDEVSGKVGDSLRANIDSVLRNHELTHLVSSVPIKYSLSDLSWESFDVDQLRTIFSKLEFKSLLAKLPAKAETTPTLDIQFSTPEEVNAKLAGFTGTIGFIFELLDERLSSYAVALSQSEVYLVMSDEIGPWLADPKIEKISHDFKSLARVIDFNGVVFDTALAAYLIDPGNRLNSIDDVLERYGFSDSSLSNKAAALFALREKLTSELIERGAQKLLTELEIPVSVVLAQMERFGVAIDKTALKEQGAELQSEVHAQSQAAFKAAGHEFNVASPKQLQVVLFDELKLPKTKKIKTGYTTDAESLQYLFAETKHPVLESLLKIREASKLQSVVEGLLNEVQADGRIHTHFQQTVAATGRRSSTGPNLQNIPSRS
ncbi:MAG: DNA polymerase, partial [Candidatus Nanopelagicaceae bacterium]